MRYRIQMTLTNRADEPLWYTFASRRSEKKARKIWWDHVKASTQELRMYRIFDTKENKVIEP